MDWMKKGCEVCHHAVLSDGELPELATSILHHARLRKCSDCGAFWIENERESHVIDDAEARATFPDAFE
jgi:hypothetical protein